MPQTSFFTTTSIAIGFMISPLSLVILGNSAGNLGKWFLWALPCIAVIHLWTAYLYFWFLNSPDFNEKITINKVDLRWFFTTLQFSSLIPFCIGASTLILAMAGYALNEIFFYWFPNLLFSICFLIFIVALNFLIPDASRHIQKWAVVVFVVSMLILIALGFLNRANQVSEIHEVVQPTYVDWRSMALLFWLFMAADLAYYYDAAYQKRSSFVLISIITAIIAVVAVFWFWGNVSMNFSSSQRLSDSTVPHSVVARAISGETGRKIMGIAILAGSFASVNTLLMGVSSVVVSKARSGQIFSMLTKKVLQGNMIMVILSIGILSMLIAGMAGKNFTETLCRSAFYLWLISHGILNLYVIRQISGSVKMENRGLVLPGIVAAATFMSGTVVLLVTDPDMLIALILVFVFIVLSAFRTIFLRSGC